MTDESSSERRSGPHRRRFLGTVGSAIGAGFLAGCGGDGSSAGTPSATPTGTATPTPTAAGTWDEGGPPDREGWQVTFADRFEGETIDRSVWENGFGGDTLTCPYHGGRSHCAVPEQSFLRDGRLVLEASAEEPTVPEYEDWQEGSDPNHSVGVVNTQDAFRQLFGYVECKARVEAQPGTNPAFWLFYIDDEYHREINVEFPGDEHGVIVDVGVVHEQGSGVARESQRHFLTTPSDEAFHVYGIDWRPDEIGLDVDGERVVTFDGDVVARLHDVAQYLVFDFGVFDAAEWIGDPADADFPLEFEVEWARAWQHEDFVE